jgi:hypothetical protein
MSCHTSKHGKQARPWGDGRACSVSMVVSLQRAQEIQKSLLLRDR